MRICVHVFCNMFQAEPFALHARQVHEDGDTCIHVYVVRCAKLSPSLKAINYKPQRTAKPGPGLSIILSCICNMQIDMACIAI